MEALVIAGVAYIALWFCSYVGYSLYKQKKIKKFKNRNYEN